MEDTKKVFCKDCFFIEYNLMGYEPKCTCNPKVILDPVQGEKGIGAECKIKNSNCDCSDFTRYIV